MRVHLERPTLPALLFATCLGVLMSAALESVSLPVALGFGVSLAVLIITIASNEVALYLLVFSMLLGPQFPVGTLGGGATLGRGITLRADDFLLLVVGFAWLAKSAFQKEVGLVFRTPLNRPIATYAFAAIFATGLGMIGGQVQFLGGPLFVLKYIEYFIVYFMAVNNLRERRQFERLLWALLVTAALVSLASIHQIPSGDRVSAPFEGQQGEPNTFGGYLVLMLSLVAGLFLTSESLRRKASLAGLAILIFLPLLFTLSRSSYVALIFMVGALLVFSQRRLLIASVLALGLVLAPFALPQAVVNRVVYTFTEPVNPTQIQLGNVRLDASTSERLESWRVAVFVDWPKHPVLGSGVTGSRFMDAQYPRVLLETGLVGLLAFLWLQATLFRQARAVFKATRDPLFKGVALGFLAGFISLIGHSIGANTFVIVRIMEPFWFLAGLVMMIPQLEAAQVVSAAKSSVIRVRGMVPAGSERF